MIDCEKCVYRKNGKCGYKKEGCNYIPVDEPVIPMSVIEQIKAEIEQNVERLNESYASIDIDAASGMKQALDIIDHHIKEFKE